MAQAQLAFGCLFIAACGGAPIAREAPAASSRALAPTAAPSAARSGSAAPGAVGALGPRVSLSEVRGESSEQASKLFAPTTRHVQECAPSGGGTVRIRVRSGEGRTSMDVEPGTTVDARTRRCVLEALSTVDPDDGVSRASPSSRPSGFSSIITVAW